jgi:hypothetical protein
MSIGEAGVPHDDASYTGEVSTSALSVQYWRDKAREFQNVLNQVDATARAAQEMVSLNVDEGITTDLLAMLADFDLKKTAFRLAAEGINAGAAIINAAGGRFPQLSIPQSLGLGPLVIPAAAIAALGTAAALITWGYAWIAGVNDRMATAQLLGTNDPEIARILARARAAQIQADQSPLQSVSGIVKWGAIALLAWMGYQAFTSRNRVS